MRAIGVTRIRCYPRTLIKLIIHGEKVIQTEGTEGTEYLDQVKYYEPPTQR